MRAVLIRRVLSDEQASSRASVLHGVHGSKGAANYCAFTALLAGPAVFFMAELLATLYCALRSKNSTGRPSTLGKPASLLCVPDAYHRALDHSNPLHAGKALAELDSCGCNRWPHELLALRSGCGRSRGPLANIETPGLRLSAGLSARRAMGCRLSQEVS